MKQRLLSMRPAVTRLNRRDARGAQLESVAAEFALLAQRRARLARQLDLLARQLQAANTSMNTVQARMGHLAQRMDQIDPGLRPAADLEDLVQAASEFQRARKVAGGAAPAAAAFATSRAADPPNPGAFLATRSGHKARQAGEMGAPGGSGGAYGGLAETKTQAAFRRPLPPRRRSFLPE